MEKRERDPDRIGMGQDKLEPLRKSQDTSAEAPGLVGMRLVHEGAVRPRLHGFNVKMG